ncbi:MAG TPA: hypothetical protein PK530_07880, partial [Anaerolineales bacterium]|nr:hypothetical protein [Anaerolineales bacterium]
MSDNPTPVEGKGNEMIPERGLPFEEETETSLENFAEPETIDQILDQVTEDIATEPGETAETPAPPPASELPPTEETPASEEPPATIASPPGPPSPPEKLLDIDEIRAREQELAEDFHS